MSETKLSSAPSFFVAARQHMLESQIRTWDVTDPRVLDLVAQAPRQEFMPERYRNLAFADINIPLGHGQVMMSPMLEARLLQVLNIQVRDKILEVGTGSGYFTWLLAKLGGHVHSVEIHKELSAAAAARLAIQGIHNVTLETGDAARGWDSHAPYDAIIVTGSTPILPDAFQRSLAVGGRLVAVVGTSPAMEACLIKRIHSESFSQQPLFETDLPPLQNAAASARFVF